MLPVVISAGHFLSFCLCSSLWLHRLLCFLLWKCSSCHGCIAAENKHAAYQREDNAVPYFMNKMKKSVAGLLSILSTEYFVVLLKTLLRLYALHSTFLCLLGAAIDSPWRWLYWLLCLSGWATHTSDSLTDCGRSVLIAVFLYTLMVETEKLSLWGETDVSGEILQHTQQRKV